MKRARFTNNNARKRGKFQILRGNTSGFSEFRGRGSRHPSAFGCYFDISEMSFFSSFEHHEHLHKEFFVRRLSENPAKVEISRPGTVVVGWLHGFHEDWLIHSQVQFLLPFYADTMASLTIPRWLHSSKKQQFT